MEIARKLRLMASPKIKMINVRLTPAVHQDFLIACDLKGASMSSLMHQFIVRTIREEKEREPQAFKSSQPKPELQEYNEPIIPVKPSGEISSEAKGKKRSRPA